MDSVELGKLINISEKVKSVDFMFQYHCYVLLSLRLTAVERLAVLCGTFLYSVTQENVTMAWQNWLAKWRDGQKPVGQKGLSVM